VVAQELSQPQASSVSGLTNGRRWENLGAIPMNIRKAIAWVVILGGALGSVSCTSVSTAEALNNEYRRRQDQQNGHPDREDGRQQKKDEERAFQEELKRKS
jgi:hypothetical protein